MIFGVYVEVVILFGVVKCWIRLVVVTVGVQLISHVLPCRVPSVFRTRSPLKLKLAVGKMLRLLECKEYYVKLPAEYLPDMSDQF